MLARSRALAAALALPRALARAGRAPFEAVGSPASARALRWSSSAAASTEAVGSPPTARARRWSSSSAAAAAAASAASAATVRRAPPARLGDASGAAGGVFARTGALDVVTEALCGGGGAEAALSAARAAGVRWDERRLATVLKLARRVAQPERLLELASLLAGARMVRLNARHYCSILQACQGRVKEEPELLETALEVYGTMMRTGVPADRSTYNVLISLCDKAGQLDRALAVHEDMQRAGVKPDIITFNTLISACKSLGEPDRAFGAYDEMRRAGVEPNVITYNALIAACGRVGQVRRAFGVRDEMRRARVRPDSYTYNALISACERAEEYERAFDTYDEIRRAIEPRSNVVTHHEKGRNVRPTARELWPNVFTYRTVISACIKGGQLARAFRVRECMQRAGVKPDILMLSTLISAFANAGRLDLALDVYYNDMPEHDLRPNVVTYNALIRACGRDGHVHRAYGVFNDMLKGGVKPDIITFLALINACAIVGEVESAFDVYRTMQRAGVLPDVMTYTALITACGKAGEVGRAFGMYDEMLRAGLEPTNKTYSALMMACAKAKGGAQWERALALYTEEMPRAGIAPDTVTDHSLQEALWAGRQYGKCADRMEALIAAGDERAGRVTDNGPGGQEALSLDLHRVGKCAACCRSLLWLDDLGYGGLAGASVVAIVTGLGRTRRRSYQGRHQSSVRVAVEGMLDALGSPFARPSSNAGRLEAAPVAVAEWLARVDVRSLLRDGAELPALELKEVDQIGPNSKQ